MYKTFAIGITAAWAAVVPAKAVTIVHNFTGVVTSVDALGNASLIPNFPAGFVPGSTQVSGNFRYQTNQTGLYYTDNGGSVGEYVMSGIGLTLPTSNYGIGNDPTAVAKVFVIDNIFGKLDLLILDAKTTTDSGVVRHLRITLTDETGSVFNSTDLPISLLLSDFTEGHFRYAQTNFAQFAERSITGEIFGPTAVATPLPGSLVLFGTVVGMAAFIRRRMIRRRMQRQHSTLAAA